MSALPGATAAPTLPGTLAIRQVRCDDVTDWDGADARIVQYMRQNPGGVGVVFRLPAGLPGSKLVFHGTAVSHSVPQDTPGYSVYVSNNVTNTAGAGTLNVVINEVPAADMVCIGYGGPPGPDYDITNKVINNFIDQARNNTLVDKDQMTPRLFVTPSIASPEERTQYAFSTSSIYYNFILHNLSTPGPAIPGIHTPQAFIGIGFATCIPLQRDISGRVRMFHEISGDGAVWFAIHGSSKDPLAEAIATTMKVDIAAGVLCDHFLDHTSIFVRPTFLEKHKIPFATFVQKPGQVVVIYPGVFYQRFDLGQNVSEVISWKPQDVPDPATHTCTSECVFPAPLRPPQDVRIDKIEAARIKAEKKAAEDAENGGKKVSKKDDKDDKESALDPKVVKGNPQKRSRAKGGPNVRRKFDEDGAGAGKGFDIEKETILLRDKYLNHVAQQRFHIDAGDMEGSAAVAALHFEPAVARDFSPQNLLKWLEQQLERLESNLGELRGNK